MVVNGVQQLRIRKEFRQIKKDDVSYEFKMDVYKVKLDNRGRLEKLLGIKS